ncbi:hypothetical protein ENBRE01_2397 [Enteropsectra breve]|nr:hypothetical protein ENBRE01_2397 [Enteropsectra breve]
MIFRLVCAVSCIFFQYASTKEFLGYKNEHLLLVRKDKGVDFKLYTNNLPLPEISAGLSERQGTAEVKQAGDDLVLNDEEYGDYLQSFRIVLAADNAYYLVNGDRCLGYKRREERFLKRSCLTGHKFYLWYEISDRHSKNYGK